jgi:RNA polymerase sigma-70 factor (ECF subfamily)
VIVLREQEGLSCEAIAAVIGAPIGTVISRLARARRRLADAWEADPMPQREQHRRDL